MRLRAGELTVLLGAILLIVSLFAPAYERPAAANLDLWDTFGPAAALLLLALCGALGIVFAALTERSAALPVATAVWGVVLGLVGVIAAVVRVLERPQHATALCYGTWLALAGTIAVLGGAWQVVRDERPSRYRPARPQPRPHP
jgi:hypothetical protein